jgi:hypothetical protein
VIPEACPAGLGCEKVDTGERWSTIGATDGGGGGACDAREVLTAEVNSSIFDSSLRIALMATAIDWSFLVARGV